MLCAQEVLVYESANLQRTLFLLVEKIYTSKEHLFIYNPLNDVIQEYDKMLWTFKKISFVPHAIYGEENYEKSRIILSNNINIDLGAFQNVILIDFYDIGEQFKDQKKLIFILHNNNVIGKSELLRNLQKRDVKYFKETKDGVWEKIVV